MKFEADIVTLKFADRYAVATATELNRLCQFWGDGHPMTVAILHLASQIMRPVELTFLNWNRSYTYNADRTQIVEMEHPSYKARNRVLASHLRKVTFLMLRKPLFSRFLSRQLLLYRKLYGECLGGQVFPWSGSDSVNKVFSRMRKQKKTTADMPFLLEQTTETIKGQCGTNFRVNPYSFRRFAFTFHYWVTFKKDILTLCRFAGHANIETTWEYIYPKEAIGLTQEMIDSNITWDEFVFGVKYDQKHLAEYTQGHIKQSIAVPGQRSILHFMAPDNVKAAHEYPLGIKLLER